jgi:hypothetical protein
MFGKGDNFKILLISEDSIILENLKFRNAFLKLKREKDQNRIPIP